MQNYYFFGKGKRNFDVNGLYTIAIIFTFIFLKKIKHFFCIFVECKKGIFFVVLNKGSDMDQIYYNLKKLEEIAQGDEGFIHEMLITFVENVTTEIDSIQLLKSSEKWTDIAETAHKLASNFAYLGADDLRTLAVDIEKSVLNDKNLKGIAEKTDKLCSDGVQLISQLKENFTITATN